MNKSGFISFLIVDNEDLCRERIRDMLSQYSWARVIGEAEDGLEALAKIQQQSVDVVFLDIEMPLLNGIEVARNIQGKKPLIIFVTAFDTYTLQAFEIHAVDYLLKPCTQERFATCMKHIQSLLCQSTPFAYESFVSHADSFHAGQKMSVQDGKDTHILSMDEIVAITMESRYTKLFYNNDHLLLNESLASLLKRLDPRHFLMVHRHALVNMNFVTRLQRKGLRYQVLLDSPSLPELPIARARLKSIKDWLAFYHP